MGLYPRVKVDNDDNSDNIDKGDKAVIHFFLFRFYQGKE